MRRNGRNPRFSGHNGTGRFSERSVPFLYLEKMVVLDPLEVFESHRFIETFVMVSSHKIFLSLEALQGKLRLLRPHEGEIANDIDLIPVRDGVIPIIDKRLVHLVHALEGAVAVLDDVFVAEMKIGCEEDFSVHSNSLVL